MQKTETYSANEGEVVLFIKDLRLDFHTYAGDVKALDGVNLKIHKGEAVGLVGESGCGKSVTALAMARLLPEPAKITSGEILLKGEDLLKKSNNEMRMVRARNIAMIFQDPMTFLNPVLTIGQQLEEVFKLDPKALSRRILERRIGEAKAKLQKSTDPNELSHLKEEMVSLESKLRDPPKLSRGEVRRAAKAESLEALRLAKMPDPERILKEYPHELSGGMRQRAMIAMALARNPDILVADEITTALDVTVQAQILSLLEELRDKIKGSILLITHDLGVVADLCDRIAIMYAGNIVELALVKELFKNPLHPYTQGLLKAIPEIEERVERLDSIPGSVPDLIYPPSGCRFHPRCPYAFEKCKHVKPPDFEVSKNHFVACHLYGEKEA